MRTAIYTLDWRRRILFLPTVHFAACLTSPALLPALILALLPRALSYASLWSPTLGHSPHISLQKGPSWGLSFFSHSWGLSFFRKKPKNKKQKTKKHSPAPASASSGPWVRFFFVFFWFFGAFAHKHQENQKTKKRSPSSEDDTLLMLS